MALDKYSEEQIKKMSMMELASNVLKEEKTELNFKELFDKVAELKQFTEEQKEDLLARFYTDLNVDGRFSTIGSNKWGLKRWYPVEQTSEKALAESRLRDLEDEDEEEELYDEDDLYFEDDDEYDEDDDEVDDDGLEFEDEYGETDEDEEL